MSEQGSNQKARNHGNLPMIRIGSQSLCESEKHVSDQCIGQRSTESTELHMNAVADV
jgi:hypothetical protein